MTTIVAAAIFYNNKIWTLPKPNRHADIVRHIKKTRGKGISGPSTDGFINNDGIFLNRVEALDVALKASQCNYPHDAIKNGSLYSEDLW